MVARDPGRKITLSAHPTQDAKGRWSEPQVGSDLDRGEDHEPSRQAAPVRARSTVRDPEPA